MNSLINIKDRRIITALRLLAAAAVCLLWWHMHTYRLDTVPYEMHVDEYGIAYDAYCIANYGVDKWLNENPVYLNNLGGGSSIAYTMLCALCMKITGSTSTFVIRLPAVMISFISMLLLFLIVRKRFGEVWGFIAALMFNVLPYYTMQSRFALDCNFMLCAMLAVIWFYYRAFEKPDWKRYLVLGIVCGAALYTYIVSWVVMPVVILFAAIYGFRIKKINLKLLIAQAVPCAVIAAPLMLCAMVNVLGLEAIDLGFFTVPRLLEDRVTVFSFTHIFQAAGDFISVIFFGDGLSYNSLYGYFTLYMVSVPFVITGFVISAVLMVKSVRDGKFDVLVLINILFVAELILSMMLGHDEENVTVNVNRINGVFAAAIIYLMTSFYYVYVLCRQVHDKLDKKVRLTAFAPLIAIAAIYCVKFVSWDKYYFTNYRIDFWPQYCFSARLDDVVNFFGDDFYTENVHMDATYAQMLLATKISPYEFNAPEVYSRDKDMQSWKNMTFNVYGDIDTDDIYIIYKGHPEFIEYYMNFDFKIYESESYVCFYN